MPKRQIALKTPASAAPDAFFEVFSLTRMRGESVTNDRLLRNESRDFPSAAAYFHSLDGPSCTLRIADSRRKLILHSGDLIFLPHGDAHRIECTAKHDAPVRLTTGVFRFESAYGNALTRSLPQWLHVSQLDRMPTSPPISAVEWLAVTLAAMRVETEQPTLGSAVMLSRLIDLLFVWAVRHWLASSPKQPSGWIAALQDPMIGEALSLLHADPARDWSVDALAERLHQSRSGLSQRFVALVGEPPIRYLTRWRMHLAAELLASSNLRVSQIAERVGYDSEPAFSRAFRRYLGEAPVEYRNARKAA